MAPAFIADSDDESESNTFSPPPAAQVEEPPSFVSSKSDAVSLATSSTDPVFFQGIYKEQFAAAREQQMRDEGANFPPTAPAGTEQTDPVSLPSQYPDGTSFTAGDANHGYASNTINSAITGANMTTQEPAGVVDPYAFPSSAEEGQIGGRAGRTKSTLSVAYRETGHVCLEEDNIGPPSRKRQRLETARNDNMDSSLPPTAPPIYNSIPPTLPPGATDTKEAGVLSNVTPTMSISNDPSLIINPRGLTSSQKEEYVAVELPASSNPTRGKEQDDLLGQPLSQSTAKLQQQKPRIKTSTSPKMKKTRQRRGKSQPEEGVTGSIQLGTPAQTQDEKSTMILLDSEDEGDGENYTQAAETPEPEDVYEVQPSPAKAPKKRGRPRKAAKPAEESAVVAKIPEKVAKKRGRPKKSDAIALEQEDAVVEVRLDESPKETIGVNEMADETTHTSNTAAETKSAPEEEKPAVATSAAKETPQKPSAKGMTTSQQGSAGKPLYRIGLSKRSRIAPLLKSLPK